MIPVLSFALLASLTTNARADEGIDSLLDKIPTIENPEAKEADKTPPPAPDMPFTTYIDLVRAQVLAVWSPKAGAIKKNPGLETRLVVQVDATGAVSAIKPMVLSGDKKFDDSAVRAVNDAGTLPAPAPNLVSVAAEGVVVVFNGGEWLKAR